MTIWVIIALVIVGAIILVYSFTREEVRLEIREEISPQGFVEDCARDATRDVVDVILPQGGFVSPENYKIYNDKPVAYLCLNNANYYPCINQHPLFLSEVRDEIEKNITSKVDACFLKMKSRMKDRGADVSLGGMDVEVELIPSEIRIGVDRDVTITRQEETQTLKEMNFRIDSPVYELINVAMEIANSEAKFCYFEHVGYMIAYPEFKIEKHVMSDETKIYTIVDKKTGKELSIAIRSCVIPPGM